MRPPPPTPHEPCSRTHRNAFLACISSATSHRHQCWEPSKDRRGSDAYTTTQSEGRPCPPLRGGGRERSREKGGTRGQYRSGSRSGTAFDIPRQNRDPPPPHGPDWHGPDLAKNRTWSHCHGDQVGANGRRGTNESPRVFAPKKGGYNNSNRPGEKHSKNKAEKSRWFTFLGLKTHQKLGQTTIRQNMPNRLISKSVW